MVVTSIHTIDIVRFSVATRTECPIYSQYVPQKARDGMTAAAEKTRVVGPYTRPFAISKIDQRTREARLIRETREELVRHVGGRPSATQAAMIEQLVQLKLRLAVMDRKFNKAGDMTEHDSRTYLAWANTYARNLARLGMRGTAEARPDLAAYLASRDAA
jgi:hypothetical protein